MKKTWIYYGIFFSDKTKQAILEYAKYWIYKKFNNDIPDDWKIYCDHVTLVFNDGKCSIVIGSVQPDKHLFLSVDLPVKRRRGWHRRRAVIRVRPDK